MCFNTFIYFQNINKMVKPIKSLTSETLTDLSMFSA